MSELNEEFYDNLKEKIQPYFVDINPCHDFSHIERVLELAMQLAEKENEYSKEDSAYHEYLMKLSKIKNKMLTKEGKRVAEERHNYMNDFFERVNKEVRGEL